MLMDFGGVMRRLKVRLIDADQLEYMMQIEIGVQGTVLSCANGMSDVARRFLEGKQMAYKEILHMIQEQNTVSREKL